MAQAFANIAFIKYWGNLDPELRLPANGSISMNLNGLYTQTQVIFSDENPSDVLILDGSPAGQASLTRVSNFLDLVRQQSGSKLCAFVDSKNNFPSGAGIASSASAFAALAVASTCAAGLELNQRELSRLARKGSGSACRSIPDGFVEWFAGTGDHDSYAESIANPDDWGLIDCIALVNTKHKSIGSSQGHALAGSSPLQVARVADTPRRLDLCRQAILQRDFDALAEITELDSNLMHAVMATSTPPLIYYLPATIEIIHAAGRWRREGLPVCYTIDAGPNVHVLTTQDSAPEVEIRLKGLPGVLGVLTASPGKGARLISS